MSELIDRQETIDRFNVIRPVDPKKDEYTKGIDVGIAMCVVAVKDQPTIPPEKAQLSQEGTTSDQPVATDTNVGDTISRQQAIDALDCISGVEEVLRSLPSAQPERKTGKWIYDENGMDWNLGAWVCSECHCRNDNIPTVIKFGNEYKRIADPRSWQGSRFCPNCGADMRGEQDG